jgi:putative flippase GtrA
MSIETLRILKFVIVGIFNTAIDLTLFWILINSLTKLKLPKRIAENVATFSHITSFLITNSISYVINSNFTFSDASNNRGWVPYLLVSAFSLGVSSSLIYFLTRPSLFLSVEKIWQSNSFLKKIKLTTKGYAFGVKLCTVAVTMVTNYLGYRFLVF